VLNEKSDSELHSSTVEPDGSTPQIASTTANPWKAERQQLARITVRSESLKTNRRLSGAKAGAGNLGQGILKAVYPVTWVCCR
jgi:hypothetical protein